MPRASRLRRIIHGKNLTDKRCITASNNFLALDPFTGAFIFDASGSPIPTLGREGVLTACFDNPRQVFLSLEANF